VFVVCCLLFALGSFFLILCICSELFMWACGCGQHSGKALRLGRLRYSPRDLPAALALIVCVDRMSCLAGREHVSVLVFPGWHWGVMFVVCFRLLLFDSLYLFGTVYLGLRVRPAQREGPAARKAKILTSGPSGCAGLYVVRGYDELSCRAGTDLRFGPS
jgi:hypothetical protein